MTNIEKSVEYHRGYEHGWMECMNEMLKPLIELEKNGFPKTMLFHGYQVVEDSNIPKGQMKIKNNLGQELTLNIPSHEN